MDYIGLDLKNERSRKNWDEEEEEYSKFKKKGSKRKKKGEKNKKVNEGRCRKKEE